MRAATAPCRMAGQPSSEHGAPGPASAGTPAPGAPSHAGSSGSRPRPADGWPSPARPRRRTRSDVATPPAEASATDRGSGRIRRRRDSSPPLATPGRCLALGSCWWSSSLPAFLPSVDVSEEHVEGVVEEAVPAVTARVVGDLLIDQPGDKAGEQVEVAGVRSPRLDERLSVDLEALDRRGIRLRRRLEVGNRALEQQLVPGWVLETEVDELPATGAKVGPNVAGARRASAQFEVLPASLAEQSVVDGVFGLEVRVQRLGPHPHLLAQIPQRQAGDPVLADELPRRLEDLRPGGLTAFGPPVSHRYS